MVCRAFGENKPFTAALFTQEVARRIERHEDPAVGQSLRQPLLPAFPRLHLLIQEPGRRPRRKRGELAHVIAQIAVQPLHPDVRVFVLRMILRRVCIAEEEVWL